MTYVSSSGFMVNKFVNFIIFAVVISIAYPSFMNAQKSEAAPYLQYVNEITNTFAKDMKNEFGLVHIGDGGRMPYDVEEIEVSFIAYRKASIEEARALEVKATERFLQIINDHQKIRPYLKEYPFTPKRVEVCIAFNKKDNTHFTGKDSVAYMSLLNGKIFYRGADPFSKNLFNLHTEPYEEALQIVKASSSH